MPQADAYCRHDWVALPDHWRDRLAEPLAAQDEVALALWSEKGRPLVVARRLENDAPDRIRLGLALPGKRRIGLTLPAEALAPPRRAPLLLDVVSNGAAFWPEAMCELAATIGKIAPGMRVFGSFAWQFFAADPAMIYVTQDSDIDLLMAPSHDGRLANWIAALQNFESRWPAPRLDGEIALPAGGFVSGVDFISRVDFVSWREFAARPKKILVKGADHVCLRPIEQIDALLAARAA
jgi:phosphoribosyl-dephospho-CoA transferase